MNVLETYTQEEVVAHMLRTMGIAPHQRGWEHLNIAINLIIEDTAYLHNMTKMLYPTIAERTGVTAKSVERAIRHSIVEAFDRVPADAVLHKIFDDFAEDAPCVSLFVATVAELYKKEKHHPIFYTEVMGGLTSEQ